MPEPIALVTLAELDKMPRTPGICAYCLRDTMVYALAEFTCRKCVLAACPECNGQGCIEVSFCTCGVGRGGYWGMHEPGCGTEPCPRGCPYVPPTAKTEA